VQKINIYKSHKKRKNTHFLFILSKKRKSLLEIVMQDQSVFDSICQWFADRDATFDVDAEQKKIAEVYPSLRYPYCSYESNNANPLVLHETHTSARHMPGCDRIIEVKTSIIIKYYKLTTRAILDEPLLDQIRIRAPNQWEYYNKTGYITPYYNNFGYGGSIYDIIDGNDNTAVFSSFLDYTATKYCVLEEAKIEEYTKVK